MSVGKIGQRLILITAVSLLGLSAISALAVFTLNQVKVKGAIYDRIILGKDLVADILPPPEYIIETYLVMLQMQEVTKPDAVKALVEKCKTLKKDFEDRHEYWQKNLTDGEIKTTIVETSYLPAKKFYDVLETRYIPAIFSKNKEESQKSEKLLEELYAAHRKAIDSLVVMVNKENDEIERQTVSLVKTRYFWLSIVGILVLFGVAGVSIVATVYITADLKAISDSLVEGAEQTALSSSEVSSAAQQLSQGATQQAASLEETSSSLDEMSSMTKQNADNASKANRLSLEACSSAEGGNQAMTEMQTAMTAIHSSSDKISKIIKTIEEIAFQTNLLALNAAVEAARAGEHGKGFAVVAEEVRSLAKRSAEAAKNTAELIQDNIEKTKDGAEISKKAGEALAVIVQHSKEVADIIAAVATANKEQAEGINQISSALSQMDQVTQQTASVSEEAAASAEELSAQAETLKSTVAVLQRLLDGNTVIS